MASTAGDIILGALLNISSYSPGEPLTSQESSIGLGVLNDLLDSLSNDETFVYTQQETIFTWVAGQYQYAVGNYTGGTYAGSLTINTPTLTTTSLPAAVAAVSYTHLDVYKRQASYGALATLARRLA